MMLSFEEKYQAIETKDPAFEGTFISAVKTTGIFCRPVCPARKPKKENVEFFNTPREALQHGYRPCKVCKPMERAGALPSSVADLLRQLDRDPFYKLKDKDIKDKGLQPNKIRRWFKRHYGMTFQAYQRMLRINSAYNHLSAGKSVTHAAYDNGFDSLSGFNQGFQKVFGSAPGSAEHKTVINLIRLTTPLGPMFAGSTAHGVCMLEFTDRKGLENEFKDLCSKLNGVILPGTNSYLDQLQKQLNEYFQGSRKEFKVQLHTPGTDFQNRVWTKLQDIPYGKTRSYSEQAQQLKQPQAIRAVASANGQNKIAIVIPCHRVIGKDGSLTGYGGGLSRKKWLLDFESRH